MMTSGCELDQDFGGVDGDGAEDAAVAVDFVFGAGGFAGIVAELDGGAAFDGHELADEADGFEVACRRGDGSRGSRW